MVPPPAGASTPRSPTHDDANTYAGARRRDPPSVGLRKWRRSRPRWRRGPDAATAGGRGGGEADDGAADPGNGRPAGAVPQRRRARSGPRRAAKARVRRSEEHTSEPQSLMRISYAVFGL